MATLMSASISSVRKTPLLEATARHWTDAELLDFGNLGIKDLWKGIIDLHEEHFLTNDITNVSISASASQMSSVPADVFRIHTIEPVDLSSSGSARGVMFIPKRYNHPDFVQARSIQAVSPTHAFTMFYKLVSAGPPVSAPVIYCAPKLSSAMAAGTIRLVYVPTLAAVTTSSNNPIPGESDMALVAWIGAYARSKERDDRSPDPNWLAVYQTEKSNLLTALTPRDEEEREAAEGLFEYLRPE